MSDRPTTHDPRPTVLLVSNGHGEDAVGAEIGRHLQPAISVIGYPLVGTGGSYSNIPLLQPMRNLPSGGFAARGTGLVADVRAGGLGHWWAQRRSLLNQHGRYNLILAVGDTFCLWMAAAAGAPAILIATAKSSRHDPPGWLDVLIMRRLARRVFTRDGETGGELRARGVDAIHLGNPLMDTIGTGRGENLRRVDRHIVALLPGSRQEAYQNLVELLQLADVVSQKASVTWLCALARGLDRAMVATVAKGAGWMEDGGYLRKGSAGVALTDDFAGAIREADVVVAMAGTATEQAAGVGRPVVAFPGTGPQVTRRFLALQQRLLGDALVASPAWTEAAAVVLRLLSAPEERLRRGAAGRLRMGPPGAIPRIAKEILASLGAETRKRGNEETGG